MTTTTTTTTQRSTPFYFGGVSSCVAAMVVHPLDLTKVRLQNLKGNGKVSMLKTMIMIARNEGFLRLYAGLSASILRQATYSTARFGAYEKLKQGLLTKAESPTVWQLLFCSSAAGALGGVCGNPADVLNVRMQNDGQLPPHQRRNYKSALDGIIRMSREEGVSSLFRGLGPNVNRAILMTSSQCVSYDIFKDLLLRHSPLEDGLTLHFTSSVLAGLVATTVCSPVDVIKTRIMAASGKERKISSLQVMGQMYKMEGMRAFFKGWTPAFIRLGPQTIITFVVLEQLKTWHQAFSERQELVVMKI
ncbi:mitochondrial carrier domain-containing protein [Zychaea mexicana]|uniref:mitochondrial carrier domain-containing protein n=1 Tax=Zychaea mexicana TaxID=64656 RepID=UPI0022FE9948|nr:mitochondrial carrier domain-containing protein [Zychaea mexicana]KAI9491150.1 mitochondrial carrier domain-containing protein [Zychaea mexicana]